MRRALTLAAALAAAGVMLVPASPASAQEPADCTTTVIDNSQGHLLNGRDASLQTEITRLQSLGASVRVRVEENLPAGNRAYKDDGLKRCESWRTTYQGEAVLQHNMVLIVYGASVNGDYTQREVAITVGRQWIDKGIDEDELTTISTKQMRPTLLKFDHLKPETFQDVPDGLAKGAHAVADDIKDGVHHGMPWWGWALIIGGIIVVIVVVVLVVRGGGSGGGYRSGGYGYGGYSSTTFISSDSGGAGGGGGFSGGDATGSSNC